MSFNRININQLTNLEANYYLGVKARACAQRMKIGKDKVYQSSRQKGVVWQSYVRFFMAAKRRKLSVSASPVSLG